MKVGIAGAGIAGLSAAAFLARAGHDVTVYDQFPQPRPVGSGLMIQPVGLQVLSELGLADDVLNSASPITRIVGETYRGLRILETAYSDLRSGACGLAIQRARLFDLLLGAARDAGAVLVPDTTITAQDQGCLLAVDARLGPFDLILDCLGAYSSLCPRPSKPLQYGALWALLDWPEGSGFQPDWLEQRYEHARKMVGILPVGTMPGQGEKLTFFWSLKGTEFATWRETPLQTWKNDVAALWPETTVVLDQITSHDDLVFAQYTHHTVRRPGRGKLAHLGDSHHATSPQLGQGANTALLDASALAKAIEASPNVEDALRAYGHARRFHVSLYQTASWAFTPLYQSDSRALPWLRNYVLAPLARIPPMPWILAKLVAGELLPPIRSIR